MIQYSLTLLTLCLHPLLTYAQEGAPIGSTDQYVVAVNLAEYCKDQPTLCAAGLDKNRFSFRLKDHKNADWVLKARVGFTRALFAPTNVEINTPEAQVSIKNYRFVERTSASAFNPADWVKVGNPLEWIDEPSNMADVNLEYGDGKNVFFLTMTHPKRTKSASHDTNFVEGTIGNTHVAKDIDLNSEDFSDPTNLHILRFDNTYRQVDAQLGYGRKIQIVRFGKNGNDVLNYTPHIHAGLTTGAASLVTSTVQYQNIEHNQTALIQGWNASLGHLLELETKRVTFFVDQKFTYSQLHTHFNDGDAKYNLKYMQVGLGVGIKVFRIRPKFAM